MSSQAATCRVIELDTPKGLSLFGLWYGPAKPKRAYIFIHGLTSSVFGSVARNIMPLLVDKESAVLTFNNRGHDIVSRISGEKKSVLAGSSHEVFTDCVDDIQGAVSLARKSGAKEIYLIGHSTGCQKAIYYAGKSKDLRGVKGVVLMAPVSDYAAALSQDSGGKLAKTLKIARAMVKAGRGHELLPSGTLGHSPDDAQRFISLYTPDSVETIFPYEQKGKVPKILRAVRIPILMLWAGNDEYADRPAGEIAAWFDANISAQHTVAVVPDVKHSFKGADAAIADGIRRWIRA